MDAKMADIKKSKVLEDIRKLLQYLKKIEESNFPINLELYENHRKRICAAQKYSEELRELITTLPELPEKIQIERVSRKKFYSIVKNSDFATIEYNGYFCKVANISVWGKSDKVIIWLMPKSEI